MIQDQEVKSKINMTNQKLYVLQITRKSAFE